ncbi:MAG: DUF309 domain-containing protein [Cyanobacteriota bacterium]|nr:DUF309 domain-containing protein [Cyanobacteriota bacterium]
MRFASRRVSGVDGDDFRLAIDQFNGRGFYACHDTLERLWLEAKPADRKFYQGLLQLAVAYYHLSQNNWRGCVILLGEGVSKLADYLPSYHGIHLESLVESSQENLQELQALGSDQVRAFDAARIPLIGWCQGEL